MSTLLVAVLLAQVAVPDETARPVQHVPTDAPTVVRLEAGVPAPFSGVLLTEAQSMIAAQRIRSAEAERDALRESAPSWVQLAIAAGVGLAVGATVVGVVAAVTRR